MKWIEASTKPAPDKNVLISWLNSHGNRRYAVGCWTPKHHTEVLDAEDWDEYCEKDETYYVVEGWYEQQLNWSEYSGINVSDGIVDFWQEIDRINK